MNASRFAFAAAILAAGGAQAQLMDPASQPRLQAQPSPEARAFARMPAPFERAYMVDEGAHPFTRLFEGYRSDPRLVAGINLNRYLALEAGYRERKDRGFHSIDPHDPLDTTGALGTQGFHTYVAVKATAPITDRLSAYGALGTAHSERRGGDALGKTDNVDTGTYTRLGAQYKLNEKASVIVESQNFGNTSQKWGQDTNGNGVNAKLKLGF
ncbi:outer membrane beta-barrel protein [Massilia sp. LXY-6]|uniref:outer membrane beta-barrel protein n=1 Tax=Massilia sp. LXY-6 TaxID=3379823 RepID=UPI003EE1325E